MEASRVAPHLAKDVAASATVHETTVAVAESVTAGSIATSLAAAPDASAWFRGGVVAYSAHAKHKLLAVAEGPTISAACAEAMASGVADLMDADFALSVTGVGGPDPVEDQPPGTVWFGVSSPSGSRSHCRRFDGSIEAVLSGAIHTGLELLRDAMHEDRGISK